jgi:hypothetical protein
MLRIGIAQFLTLPMPGTPHQHRHPRITTQQHRQVTARTHIRTTPTKPINGEIYGNGDASLKVISILHEAISIA